MKLLLKAVTIASAIVATPVLADSWTLAPDGSHLAYGTIKKDAVGEVNSFTNLIGHVSPDGRAEIEIDLSSVETNIDIRNERMIEHVFSKAPNPLVVLRTNRGPLTLELLREQAPLHVASFLRLASEGTYTGLRFHRIVTGFVAQGLDPRGDGWGTGGVFLRDEINPVPYRTGAVGMPNAGPDTGGCQLFITHVPTPHLDGGYTVFAQVVEGFEVLDSLDLGDVCERIESLPPR